MSAKTRISQLEVGDRVKLRFTREGDAQEAEVVDTSVEGNVTFTYFDEDAHIEGANVEFTAYTFNGRWCYGTSADRLVLLSVLACCAEADEDPDLRSDRHDGRCVNYDGAPDNPNDIADFAGYCANH